MSDSEDREAILARRRRFITIALATAGVAGCDRCAPQPCLEPVPVGTHEIEPTEPEAGRGGEAGKAGNQGMGQGGAPPMPCLSPPAPDPEGGHGAAGDGRGGGDAQGKAPDGTVPPLPTAGPKPPTPRVCLRIAPPLDWEKK